MQRGCCWDCQEQVHVIYSNPGKVGMGIFTLFHSNERECKILRGK